MSFFKNKYFLALAFVASVLSLSVLVGGEFFHQHIHHHQSQASHDDCPMYQLLVQAFLFTVAFAFGLQVIKFYSIVLSREVLVSSPQYLLPSLRAPPISL